MERLADIEIRIGHLAELMNVLGAMRSLAAVRLGEARASLAGVRHYVGVVEEALAQAVPLLPQGDGGNNRHLGARTAYLVFAAEHGFVGGFNEHILDRLTKLRARPDDPVLMIGARGLVKAAERNLEVSWSYAMATKTAAVVDVARRGADRIYRGVAKGEFSRLVAIHAGSTGGAQWELRDKTLLPFDPQPYRAAGRAIGSPLLNLRPAEILPRLVDEFVFAEIMRAAMESFASENGARLTAMDSAHYNIEEKLAALRLHAGQLRQENITMELLDVVTGAEAMANTGHR